MWKGSACKTEEVKLPDAVAKQVTACLYIKGTLKLAREKKSLILKANLEKSGRGGAEAVVSGREGSERA